LKLNGAHQLLVYADDVNILGGTVHTIQKNVALVVASKEIGLEVNADKTKHMALSWDQKAVRSHSLNIDNSSFDNSSFERVEEFKYLETALTNQNSIQEEIKSRLKTGNSCYHSVQNLLSSSLLTKNLKIKTSRIPILSVVLYGCETWSFTLREERSLKVSENSVLRRIFGPKWDEVKREWRKLHNEELNDLYSSPSFVQVIKSRSMRWAGHERRMGERRGVYRVLVGKPLGKRPPGRPRRRRKDNIKMDLQEAGCGGMNWIELA